MNKDKFQQKVVSELSKYKDQLLKVDVNDHNKVRSISSNLKSYIKRNKNKIDNHCQRYGKDLQELASVIGLINTNIAFALVKPSYAELEVLKARFDLLVEKLKAE